MKSQWRIHVDDITQANLQDGAYLNFDIIEFVKKNFSDPYRDFK